MGVFYMLGIYLFLLQKTTQSFVSKAIIWAGIFISFVLSILSKQSAASLPIAMWLIEIIFYRSGKPRLITFALGSLVIITGLIVVIYFPPIRLYDTTEIGRDEYFLTQLKVILHYWKLMIIPFGQNIDHAILLLKIDEFKTYLYVVPHVILLGLGFYLFQKKNSPLLLFGVLWFYVISSIESTIFPIRDLMFEHRAYLGVFGFALLFAMLVQLGITRFGRRFNLVTVVVLAFFAIVSFQRNQVWRTEYLIWEDAVRKAPGKDRPNYVHAINLRDRGNIQLAQVFYERAIFISPTYVKANNDLAVLYMDQGRYAEAEKLLETAIAEDTTFHKVFTNMGLVKLKQNQPDKSIPYLQKALALNRIPTTYFNLGYAYSRNGDYDLAIHNLRRAMTRDTTYFDPVFYLGNAYYLQKDYNRAARFYRRALRIQPRHEEALRYLTNTYVFSEKYSQALKISDLLISINPGDERAIRNRDFIRKKMALQRTSLK